MASFAVPTGWPTLVVVVATTPAELEVTVVNMGVKRSSPLQLILPRLADWTTIPFVWIWSLELHVTAATNWSAKSSVSSGQSAKLIVSNWWWWCVEKRSWCALFCWWFPRWLDGDCCISKSTWFKWWLDSPKWSWLKTKRKTLLFNLKTCKISAYLFKTTTLLALSAVLSWFNAELVETEVILVEPLLDGASIELTSPLSVLLIWSRQSSKRLLYCAGVRWSVIEDVSADIPLSGGSSRSLLLSMPRRSTSNVP